MEGVRVSSQSDLHASPSDDENLILQLDFFLVFQDVRLLIEPIGDIIMQKYALSPPTVICSFYIGLCI